MSKIDHSLVMHDYQIDVCAHGETAFKMWEYSTDGNRWAFCEGPPAWQGDTFYRHRRVVVETPRPEIFAPRNGTNYWVPGYQGVSQRMWIGSAKDHELLMRGMVHLTELRAIEARAARRAIH